jgi:putative endonuclease
VHGVQRLVWYEEHFDIRDAIQREKSLIVLSSVLR